jgi:hypothetical protein
LEIIANAGNFKHNIHVLKERSGDIIVARRVAAAAEDMNADVVKQTYLPREYCLRFVVSKHFKLSRPYVCSQKVSSFT